MYRLCFLVLSEQSACSCQARHQSTHSLGTPVVSILSCNGGFGRPRKIGVGINCKWARAREIAYSCGSLHLVSIRSCRDVNSSRLRSSNRGLLFRNKRNARVVRAIPRVPGLYPQSASTEKTLSAAAVNTTSPNTVVASV